MERAAQKNRTRAALLDAARTIIARGETPTVATVARAAGVSRATAYRYFSDPGVLAIEAVLDLDVASAQTLLEGVDEVRARVHAVARYFRAFTRTHEVGLRAFLAQVMLSWAPGGREPISRGARRVPAFEAALAPARTAMSSRAHADCVAALATTTGLEPHIVLSDVCGLDAERADRVAESMVDAILDRYLGVSEASGA